MIKTVLCVDDDPITLMLNEMVLNKASFCNELVTAKNGEEAILYFENLLITTNNDNYPKLIFLDLNMPVMNGWEFLDTFIEKKFHHIFKKIKVIILSSTVDPNDIEKSKKHPIVIKFLPKPINKEMLESLKDIE
ncbi:response regulator [Flavobacterium sp.]|jgi:CheY-like chemotaxis protein|uniref:response regulator n=1 Tax=Flavobacterium sp. TaxID=239 RepID=UPI0037BE5186